MQTWARRGLQTALVTGGLLMLGTSIASANEDVDPDRPASPLDGSLTVPVHVDNNTIGTVLGPIDLPEIHHDLTLDTTELTKSLPAPVAGAVRDAARHVGESGLLRGTRLGGDVVVPIQVCGNAVAATGDAAAWCDADQSVRHRGPVRTSGEGGSLAGNVADVDLVSPIQINGNAAGIVGNASTYTATSQVATVGGDITTDGTGGALSGNVLSGQLATPLQVAGNAVAGAGNAHAVSATNGEAYANGSATTSGHTAVGSGNVSSLPVALPLTLDGNALSGIGNAGAHADNTTVAIAGTERPGSRIPADSHLVTSGDEAVLAGNIEQIAVSGPVRLDGNSGGIVGNSATHGWSDSWTNAGGTTQTSGDGSVLSGSAANAPIASPAEIFGNAGAVIGHANAHHHNTVDSRAGGDSFTHGDDSVLSGSGLTAPLTGPVDLFGNAGSVVGIVDANASNEAEAHAGGYEGTTGNDAVISGNAGAIGAALPVEGFGNGLTVGGIASATAHEHKISDAGDDTNTQDDAGVVSSNALVSSVAGPVQGFGNTLGVAGIAHGTANTDNTVTAGGNVHAHGTGGSVAGNIAHAPVSLPAQLFGSGATVVGKGASTAVGETVSTSGGNAETDGSGAQLSGNVLGVPAGSAAQLFGNAAAVGGRHHAGGHNVTASTAGGDIVTGGDFGSASGNVIGVDALPVVDAFGAAVGGLGHATAAGANDTTAISGGDATTSGDHGYLAGNLVDAPAAVVAQVFGDSVAALGNAASFADNQTAGQAGGQSDTSGAFGHLSGLNPEVPVGAAGRVHGIPLEVLANALAATNDRFDVALGEDGQMLELPAHDAGLPATALPSVLDTVSFHGNRAIPTGTPELPALSTLDTLSALGLAP